MPRRPTRLAQVTPRDAEGHFRAKERVRKDMHQAWIDGGFPSYYNYRPPFRECWNFMTLPKFAAGRIHQMRANKSYLMAQTDWSNQDRDPTCPRCREGPETLQHIVECPSLEAARRCIPTETFNLDPSSELWKNGKKGLRLVKDFASYVLKNRINFPVDVGMFPFMRNADLSS